MVSVPAGATERQLSAACALVAQGLVVRRGRRSIVEDLSLVHSAGSVAWLVGENGGGKSSLMRVLAGVSRPFAGTVRHAVPAGSAARRSYYHPDMRLPGAIRVTDWQALVGRLDLPEREIPGLVPPFARSRTPASDLSTGEEKRLILEAVLATGRDFFFLDEPFEHLSAEGKDLLVERLGRLARSRVVVVATNQGIPPSLAGGPVVRLEPAEA